MVLSYKALPVPQIQALFSLSSSSIGLEQIEHIVKQAYSHALICDMASVHAQKGKGDQDSKFEDSPNFQLKARSIILYTRISFIITQCIMTSKSIAKQLGEDFEKLLFRCITGIELKADFVYEYDVLNSPVKVMPVKIPIEIFRVIGKASADPSAAAAAASRQIPGFGPPVGGSGAPGISGQDYFVALLGCSNALQSELVQNNMGYVIDTVIVLKQTQGRIDHKSAFALLGTKRVLGVGAVFVNLSANNLDDLSLKGYHMHSLLREQLLFPESICVMMANQRMDPSWNFDVNPKNIKVFHFENAEVTLASVPDEGQFEDKAVQKLLTKALVEGPAHVTLIKSKSKEGAPPFKIYDLRAA